MKPRVLSALSALLFFASEPCLGPARRAWTLERRRGGDIRESGAVPKSRLVELGDSGFLFTIMQPRGEGMRMTRGRAVHDAPRVSAPLRGGNRTVPRCLESRRQRRGPRSTLADYLAGVFVFTFFS